ncbi:pseudouridine synthase [Caulobacter sp. S45]|uniref:pseudouridine synthase n=1 Tax=Caulobacter sp. S45 TaxID=1641861 RepID=UPI00157574BF|nr:pseudouridine synthase [Caulobacter sp. S45]
MAWTRVYTEAEPQRINRWLAQAGVCSRREAEALIAAGRLSIDGARVGDPGRKIAPGETLTLEDAASGPDAAPISVVVNKPVGIVSAQPEGRQVPAARLLTRGTLWGADGVGVPAGERLAPLGRLDMDSRGLLLLSQDGVLAKAVIGPDSRVDKQYVVQVSGPLDDRRIARLRHGLRLDGRALKPARVVRIAGQRLDVTLWEGRNRQIRRMCEAVGLDVVDLLRVRIGPLQLADLPEGRWRPLDPDERSALVRAATPGR